MNNLKRVLSMALASVMLVGMMAVGAAATNVEDFTDKDEITHTEAVNTLVALNVISGKEDGSFYDPKGSLTRAEMAKLVTFVLNGGVKPTLGTAGNPIYSDVTTHWARPEIEYCSNLKIIAGQGDGTFAPDGTLTGSAAAKMLLVAMGYEPGVFGFTGPDWELNVNIKANDAGLYNGLKGIDASAEINRDDAAQMVYNAIKAPMMVRTWSQDKTTGAITEIYTLSVDDNNLPNKTLLSDRFEATIKVGFLTSYRYDSARETWTYTFDGSQFHGSDVTALNAFSAGSNLRKSEVDYTSLWGRQVKAIVSLTNKDTLYGVYPYDSEVLVEGYYGDLGATSINNSTKEIKVKGTTYKMDSVATGIDVVTPRIDGTLSVNSTTGKQASANTLLTLNNLHTAKFPYSYKLVDNDGDGKIDIAIVTPFVFGKVTYISSTNVTVSAQNLAASFENAGAGVIGSKKLEDVAIYEDAAKDDFVMAVDGTYTATEKPTYTKLDVETDEITGRKANDNDYTKFQMSDKWYTEVCQTTLSANDEIEYVALGSVLYYAKVISGATGVESLGMIYKAGIKTPTGVSTQYPEVSVIFSDGTKKTTKLAEVNGVDVSKYDDTNSTSIANGTDATSETVTVANIDALKGVLVRAEINGDGNLEVKTLKASKSYVNSDTKILGFDGTLGTGKQFNNANDTLGEKELHNDAVVFVYNTTKNDAKIYSGRELKNNVNGTFGTGNSTYANGVYGKIDGFTYTRAAALTASAWPTINTGTNYGYLVSDAFNRKDKDDGLYYRHFKIWNGEEVLEVREKNERTVDDFKAGTVVTYDIVNDELVKNVNVPTMGIGTVDGYDNNKKVSISGSNKTQIDDDTVILYVDSKEKTGVDNGSIVEAVDLDGDTVREANVLFLEGGDKNYAVIVVDVNQKFIPIAAQVQVNQSLTGSVDPTDDGGINAKLAQNNVKITATGDLTISKAVVIPEGKTLTIEGGANKVVLSENPTMNANSKLVIKSTKDAASAVTFTQKLDPAHGATVEVTAKGGTNATIVLTAGADVKADANVTLDGAVTVSAGNVAVTKGKLTTGDVTASGQTVTVTEGSLTAKDITASTVTVKTDGALTAGTITGDLTLEGEAKASVASVTGTITGAANTELTITGDVTTITAPAGTVIFKGEVTGAVTPNAASKIVFEKAVEADTVIANSTGCTTATKGATVVFKTAPTAAGTLSAIGAAGFISNDGSNAITDIGDVVVNATYKIDAVNNVVGLVKQA